MVLIGEVTAPEEGLVYSANDVQLKIGDKVIGTGVVYISQSSLGWQSRNMSEGISIMWKQISVHGISSTPRKCIYFMLDHQLVWRGVYEGSATHDVANGHNNDHNAEGVEMMVRNGNDVETEEQDEGNASDEETYEDAEDQITECWLMPDDVNIVDTMFQAMTECQALHPDSADSVSEESDFMDDDDTDEGDNSALGNDIIERRDVSAEAAQGGIQNLNLNDDRFADADE